VALRREDSQKGALVDERTARLCKRRMPGKEPKYLGKEEPHETKVLQLARSLKGPGENALLNSNYTPDTKGAEQVGMAGVTREV